jgi:hypothetical protein
MNIAGGGNGGPCVHLKAGGTNADDVNGYPIGVTGDLRVREVEL